jgi:nucleotide-binding universal stress UspA family protein
MTARGVPPTRMERVLVAVDDSPESLGAARLAVALAAGWGARVRAVTVVRDFRAQVPGMAEPAAEDLAHRAMASAVALLARVEAMAGEAGVPVVTEALTGEPAGTILSVGRAWGADLVVIGRSRRRTSVGVRYVGSQAQHVLEFSDRPVLVVPRPAGHRS